MKYFVSFFLILIVIIIGVPVLFLGYLGFVPGLSAVMGTNKPRDLGISYSQEDLQQTHAKSQVVYQTLADNQEPTQTRQFSGSRPFTGEFSSAEITATLNNQPWIHWPYRNLQVKFNGDGSAEVSGVLIKDKVPGYAAAIGIPSQAVEYAMKYIPADPVFYVKGKAALTDNQVSLFEPQAFQIGRLSLPVNIFLSWGKLNMADQVYAQDVGQLTTDLAKVSGKKSVIVGYINGRLNSAFGNFYAKKAYFAEDKVVFDGTLSESISYSP